MQKTTDEDGNVVRVDVHCRSKDVDQIAFLQYVPEKPAKRRKGGYISQPQQEYFKGQKVEGKKREVVESLLNPGWVKFNFDETFVQLVMKCPGRWWPVVVGDANQAVAPTHLLTEVPVAFPQGEKDHCLFNCMASALYYVGFVEESRLIATAAQGTEKMSRKEAVHFLRECMRTAVPTIGESAVFNANRGRGMRKNLSVNDLVGRRTPYPTLVIPQGGDGSVSHAVCVVDDLVFDSTQKKALKLTYQTMKWVCGKGGI